MKNNEIVSIEYKNQYYKLLSKVSKSLSSEKRVEILNLLSQSPKSVEQLSKDSQMSLANVSKHLQVLNESNLVIYQKHKNHVIYSLKDETVNSLILSLEAFAENHIADLMQLRREFIDNMENVHTLSMYEVEQKLKNKEAILLDLRDKSEYDNEHIEGAISVPLNDLEQCIEHLDKEKEIIAYCRGKFCAFSSIATHTLNNNGFKAFNMDEGLHEWNQYLENR